MVMEIDVYISIYVSSLRAKKKSSYEDDVEGLQSLTV